MVNNMDETINVEVVDQDKAILEAYVDYKATHQEEEIEWADNYKKFTFKLFDYIKQAGFTVCDLDTDFETDFDAYTCVSESGVGYYGVVFKIKELKGWLFGIWYWFDRANDKVNMQLFTQYERFINKFKPSRSTLLVDQDIMLADFAVVIEKPSIIAHITRYDSEWANENACDYYMYEVKELLQYMKKYPELAYYQDNVRDLSRAYTTRFRARIRMWYDILHDNFRNFISNICDKKGLKLWKKYFLKNLPKETRVWDDGEYTSPRFEMQIPLSVAIRDFIFIEGDNKEPGFYHIAKCIANYKNDAEHLDNYYDLVEKVSKKIQNMATRAEKLFNVYIDTRYNFEDYQLYIYDDQRYSEDGTIYITDSGEKIELEGKKVL